MNIMLVLVLCTLWHPATGASDLGQNAVPKSFKNPESVLAVQEIQEDNDHLGMHPLNGNAFRSAVAVCDKPRYRKRSSAVDYSAGGNPLGTDDQQATSFPIELPRVRRGAMVVQNSGTVAWFNSKYDERQHFGDEEYEDVFYQTNTTKRTRKWELKLRVKITLSDTVVFWKLECLDYRYRNPARDSRLVQPAFPYQTPSNWWLQLKENTRKTNYDLTGKYCEAYREKLFRKKDDIKVLRKNHANVMKKPFFQPFFKLEFYWPKRKGETSKRETKIERRPMFHTRPTSDNAFYEIVEDDREPTWKLQFKLNEDKTSGWWELTDLSPGSKKVLYQKAYRDSLPAYCVSRWKESKADIKELPDTCLRRKWMAKRYYECLPQEDKKMHERLWD